MDSGNERGTDEESKSRGFVTPAPSSLTDLLCLIALTGEDAMAPVAVEKLNQAHIYMVRGDLTKALDLLDGISELGISQHTFQQLTSLRMLLSSIVDPDSDHWKNDLATELSPGHESASVAYLCIESHRLWHSGHLFQGLLLNQRALQQRKDVPVSWRLYGKLLLTKKLTDMHVHYQAHRLIDNIREFMQRVGLDALAGLSDALRSLLYLQSGRPADALDAADRALRAAERRESAVGVKLALSVASMAHLSRGEQDEARAFLNLFHAEDTDFVLPDSVARAAFADIALTAAQEGPSAAADQLLERWDQLGTDSGCFVEDPTRPAWMVATARRAGKTELAVKALRAIDRLARDSQEVQVLTAAADRARAVFRGEDPQPPLLLDLANAELPGRRGRGASVTVPGPALPEPPDATVLGRPAEAAIAAPTLRLGQLSPLTPRETDVARFVADGLTNHQIASELGLSPHTVNFHLRRIFRKLSISGRAQLGNLVAQFDNPNVH